MSDRPSIAQHYHERTKYDPETIHSKNKALDWSKQPTPYKDYKIGNKIDLKAYLADDINTSSDYQLGEWRRLSQMLLCSYGITAKMLATGGVPLYLRAAPSAGGLYPAELYLISRGNSLLAPGLYNYQPRSHSLIHFWESEIWSDLQEACFEHLILEYTDLALLCTAVFFRSAWRYEDRAYRRIFLDTGHLLGNIELAGAINGYQAYLLGGFQDQAINELLYLDPEEEGAMAVVPLLDAWQSPSLVEEFLPSPPALPSKICYDYPPIADGELLNYFHFLTEITELKLPPANSTKPQEKSLEDKYNFPFCLKVDVATSPIYWGEHLTGLEQTILRRRSTRAYSGEEITLDELKSLLNFTYQPQYYSNQELDADPDYFVPDLIETFIAVSNVQGLEEGCYYYAPQAQELRQIRFKNFRQELHYLCLGQTLGRDAAAVIFHTADLELSLSKFGDRVYRYLHMDAGHLGQKLNLAAIYLGLGVSGIGGFFDDQVNEVLGIPESEAVLYITTLGKPRRA